MTVPHWSVLISLSTDGCKRLVLHGRLTGNIVRLAGNARVFFRIDHAVVVGVTQVTRRRIVAVGNKRQLLRTRCASHRVCTADVGYRVLISFSRCTVSRYVDLVISCGPRMLSNCPSNCIAAAAAVLRSLSFSWFSMMIFRARKHETDQRNDQHNGHAIHRNVQLGNDRLFVQGGTFCA